MPEIILHHYAESPFAEKIRLILGYKKLDYRSVEVPMMMPKPDVVALTGGYRKAPVMQIGADVYCDTALIAEVIERLHPQPSLYPPPHAATARMVAAWADQHWFAAGVGYAMQPEGFRSMFAKYSEAHRTAFIEDRKAFRAGTPRLPLHVATGVLTDRLAQAERQFADGRGFLLGAEPTIADFSFYHPLWFLRNATAVAGFLSGWRRTVQWMQRMAAMGHGKPVPMDGGEAIEIARKGVTAALRTETAQAAGPCAIGSRVTVAPTDYGMDPVTGELAAEYVNEWVLRRTDARAGTVLVHFPRAGYRIDAA